MRLAALYPEAPLVGVDLIADHLEIGREQCALRPDVDRFWLEGPPRYGAAVGTDLHVGRTAYRRFKALMERLRNSL